MSPSFMAAQTMGNSGKALYGNFPPSGQASGILLKQGKGRSIIQNYYEHSVLRVYQAWHLRQRRLSHNVLPANMSIEAAEA